MEARAKERLIEEQVAYQEKPAIRQAKEQATGKKPTGKMPQPHHQGPRDKDQYNFTDPESRIIKVPLRLGAVAYPQPFEIFIVGKIALRQWSAKVPAANVRLLRSPPSTY